MGFEVRATGQADLREVRRALKQLGDKGLGRRMSRAFTKATGPITEEIRAEAGRTMPSGYGPTLSASLRFRTAARNSGRSAEVTLRVHAEGKSERRDVPRLNRGELRHPVFGRTRRLKSGQIVNRPWATQPVRRGFVDRPVEQLGPEIRKQMQAVIDDVAAELKG